MNVRKAVAASLPAQYGMREIRGLYHRNISIALICALLIHGLAIGVYYVVRPGFETDVPLIPPHWPRNLVDLVSPSVADIASTPRVGISIPKPAPPRAMPVPVPDDPVIVPDDPAKFGPTERGIVNPLEGPGDTPGGGVGEEPLAGTGGVAGSEDTDPPKWQSVQVRPV